MAGLHVPLSTLRRRPHGHRRMTRGHRGSLLLRCRAFSSLSSCRFIPAHPTFRASAQTELAPPLCRTTTRAVDRYPPGSSRSNNWTPVPIVIATLTTLHQRFTYVRLLGPHLPHHVRLLRDAHHPGSFTGATHGGLQPPPAGRLWRAHLHHRHSTATISTIFYIATSSRARGARSSAYLITAGQPGSVPNPWEPVGR